MSKNDEKEGIAQKRYNGSAINHKTREGITKSPLKSKRIKITGKASQPTAPYTVEQMRFLVQQIEDIKALIDRAYLAIQALHPLRLEEVLGLQAADIDPENMAAEL